MRNRYKVILWIVFILIIFFLIILVSFSFSNSSSQVKYEILDTIENYNYTIEDRDSTLMKDVFNNLKKVLNSSDIDYELYAEYLSELFVIDLFTLNNKNNKYDVGSIEYVYPDVVDNYILNVEDTLYKYIVDKNSKDRDNYPEVSSINKESIKKTTYTYNEKEYEAYEVSLTWEYIEDLGYQKKAKVILIKDNAKLYVMSYKGV